jgi:hypothetical protein
MDDFSPFRTVIVTPGVIGIDRLMQRALASTRPSTRTKKERKKNRKKWQKWNNTH